MDAAIILYRMTADLTLLKTELDIFWQHHMQLILSTDERR